jgi:transposase
VCPATGKTEAIVAPCLSKEVMRQHLQLISDATESGRYAVVIMDRASWHMGDVACEFENLSIIPLPPYSPELNPIEQVWQWIRDRELANRTFNGYEDIVEQVSRAWNNFRSDVEAVKRLCSRTWTNLIT